MSLESFPLAFLAYGVFLLALGLLTLILGLTPPRTTDVIIVGGAVIIAGLLEFALARGRTSSRIPASCKKEARKVLELQRTVDWEKLKTTIRFEDAGITICAEENEEHLPYTRIKSAFESLHLWLVVCDDERALLLQKKDLRARNADRFLSDCALPGFVDSKNEEKTERNAGYLVVSQSGGGMLRQGTRKGIRRTPANRGMRAHRIVKSLDISEDVCHGLCP